MPSHSPSRGPSGKRSPAKTRGSRSSAKDYGSSSSTSSRKDRSARAASLVEHRGSASSSPVGLTIPDEIKPIWKEVEAVYDNPQTVVIAIANPGEKTQLVTCLREMEGRIRARVVIVTPKSLQDGINTVVDKGYKNLHLLASSAVKQITYHLFKIAERVYVKPCNPNGQPNSLQIDGSSTYCDFATYAWDHRPRDKTEGHKITHEEGCFFDITGRPADETRMLLGQPQMMDMTAQDMVAVKNGFSGLIAEQCAEKANPSRGVNASVSPGPGTTPSQEADGAGPWFLQWGLLLAVILGGAAGVPGMGGAFWCSPNGVYIKGPFGVQLAAGFRNIAAVGGRSSAGVRDTIVSSNLVFFIPWSTIFAYISQRLAGIWDYICDVLTWIWGKIGNLTSTVVTLVTEWSASYLPPRPVQFVG